MTDMHAGKAKFGRMRRHTSRARHHKGWAQQQRHCGQDSKERGETVPAAGASRSRCGSTCAKAMREAHATVCGAAHCHKRDDE